MYRASPDARLTAVGLTQQDHSGFGDCVERKLAAILCADVFGYSRLMGEDEEATLRTLSSHRKLIDSLIEQHHGRFVNSAGDSVLAEFASVVNAVQCAADIQTALKAENANLPTDRRMEFRIGVNLGDVMVEGEQIYGDGVNVAARLESLAEPGGINISASIHEQIWNKLQLGYEDLGEQQVKNITKPVRVFRVLPDGNVPTLQAKSLSLGNYWRSVLYSLAGVAIIVVAVVLIRRITPNEPRTNVLISPQESPGPRLPSMPSIAVLPFTNLSGDPKQEYFSDGVTGQIISELSHLPGLFVIARNSSFSYKGKTVREEQVGRDLGVKYVLEGSVQKTADRIRIGVELVNASTGVEIWSQQYDQPIKDIFALQDEIAGKIVTTLGLILKQEQMKVPHGAPALRTENLEAFDDVLRAGAYFTRFTREDHLKERVWLEKAVALDPAYSQAYAMLAGNYSNGVLFGWSENPARDFEQASSLAQKALTLDDSNSYALAKLCEIHWQQKRYERAIAECKRVVALDPNSADGYLELADALTAANRPEEAIHAVETASRLDPTRPEFYAYFIAAPYVLMGHYQQAIPLLKEHIAAYPNQPFGHIMLVVAYMEIGREQDAHSEAANVIQQNPRFMVSDIAQISRDPAINHLIANDLHKAGLR